MVCDKDRQLDVHCRGSWSVYQYEAEYIDGIVGDSVEKIVGVTELQRRFRAIFDEVARERIPYVLTRGSRPEAVLVPYDEFRRLKTLEDREVLARFDRLLARMAQQNAHFPDEEVEADVEAARTERAS